MNKKGIFFTITAVLLSAVILTAFLPLGTSTLDDKDVFVDTQISVGNSIVTQITDSFAPKAAEVAAFHALRTISEIEKLTATTYTEDHFKSNFSLLVLNGTLNCPSLVLPGEQAADDCLCQMQNDVSPGSCADPLDLEFMRGKSMVELLYSFAETTERAVGAEVNFTFLTEDTDTVLIKQDNNTGPFAAEISLLVNYTVEANAATWSARENISEVLNLQGIEDPLYSVQTQVLLGGLSTRVFNRSPSFTWNITQVWFAIENRTYVANPNASSFIQRFYGSDDPSDCCGVESFVNPQTDGQPSGVSGLENKPYVDWCMFGQNDRCAISASNPTQVWNISCIGSDDAAPNKFQYFTLDSSHVARYNLSGFEYNNIVSLDPEANCGFEDIGAGDFGIMEHVCMLDPSLRPSYLNAPGIC